VCRRALGNARAALLGVSRVVIHDTHTVCMHSMYVYDDIPHYKHNSALRPIEHRVGRETILGCVYDPTSGWSRPPNIISKSESSTPNKLIDACAER
jgi:hypothetical protein